MQLIYSNLFLTTLSFSPPLLSSLDYLILLIQLLYNSGSQLHTRAIQWCTLEDTVSFYLCGLSFISFSIFHLSSSLCLSSNNKATKIFPDMIVLSAIISITTILSPFQAHHHHLHLTYSESSWTSHVRPSLLPPVFPLSWTYPLNDYLLNEVLISTVC